MECVTARDAAPPQHYRGLPTTTLDSVLDGMPAFKKIMQDQSFGIESEVCAFLD